MKNFILGVLACVCLAAASQNVTIFKPVTPIQVATVYCRFDDVETVVKNYVQKGFIVKTLNSIGAGGTTSQSVIIFEKY